MRERKTIKQFQPTTFDRNIQEWKEMNDTGLLDFSIDVQRPYKMKDTKLNNRKSKLIFTICANGRISDMICNKVGNSYQIPDGQQRLLTVFDFIDGKFKIKGVDLIDTGIGEAQDIVDIEGKLFSELPQKMQNRILSFKPVVEYHENLSPVQLAYLFVARNNGIPIDANEKDRVDTVSQRDFIEVSSHELFENILSAAKFNSGEFEIITKQTWVMLNIKRPDFTKPKYVPVIKEVIVTDEEKKRITAIYDKLNECYIYLKKQLKVDQKQLTIMFGKLHVVSLARIIDDSINNDISVEKLCEWLTHFFICEKGKTTISKSYNNACLSGSAAYQKVKSRVTALLKDYKEFMEQEYIDPFAADESDYEPSESQPDTNENDSQNSSQSNENNGTEEQLHM